MYYTASRGSLQGVFAKKAPERVRPFSSHPSATLERGGEACADSHLSRCASSGEFRGGGGVPAGGGAVVRGVLFAAAAGGRRGSGGSVVAGPAGPHRPLAAGPYL